MEYGPAPESASAGDRVARRATGGASASSSTARFTAPGHELLRDRQPGDRRSPSRASPRRAAADVDRGGRRGPRAQPGWAQLPATRAPATSTPSRARCRSTARLLAVLETLDNGKPIRETRDIDIPLVARHFYHHAGWAQLHGRASSPATRRSASSARSSRGTSRC